MTYDYKLICICTLNKKTVALKRVKIVNKYWYRIEVNNNMYKFFQGSSIQKPEEEYSKVLKSIAIKDYLKKENSDGS